MQGVYFSISKEIVINPKGKRFEDSSNAMQCERERNTQATLKRKELGQAHSMISE